MKYLVLVALVALCSTALHAQSNPPFQNPSLDSNCYFPQIGMPGEIDTIYGSYSGEGLGAFIHNLGPKSDGSFGNMLIGSGEVSPLVNWSLTPTGQNFDLHDLKAKAQSLKIDPQYLHFGHFRDRAHMDILDADWPRIYWADENGNYDSSHYTNLKSNLYGRLGYIMTNLKPPYVAHLTNDTIDDIVLGIGIGDSASNVTQYLGLFKGGADLFSRSTAYEDTSLLIGPNSLFRVRGGPISLAGDFRGTGRDDLLICDDGDFNLFFFRNDPPFTLDKLRDAMLYDTLWTSPERIDRAHYPSYYVFATPLVMHALPKRKGDNSYDWLVWIPTKDSGDCIFIFRGGSDFGSHRITVDSAAYIIKKPRLGYQIWPGLLTDAGDMTGTGNHVLYTGGGAGGAGGYADQNYYVTGQALDDKIDVFYRGLGGVGDTLTADEDTLQDLLLGNSAYDDPQDQENDSLLHGTIWVVHGSNQIPVHLNPQFADVKSIAQQDGVGISFSPNPVTRGWSVATILWPEAESAEYSIYDVLGKVVARSPIRLLGGAEQQRIYFPTLSPGAYLFSIVGARHSASTRLVFLKAD